MKVTPNPERRAKLLDNARSVSNVDTQREGIHLSDLTRCVTKSFWTKYGKHKEKTPDKTVMFFLIGLGLEKMLRGNMPVPPTGEKDGVLYSPDHWDDEFDMFDEIKSTRMGWKKDATEPSKGWPIEWVRRIMGVLLCYRCYQVGPGCISCDTRGVTSGRL